MNKMDIKKYIASYSVTVLPYVSLCDDPEFAMEAMSFTRLFIKKIGQSGRMNVNVNQDGNLVIRPSFSWFETIMYGEELEKHMDSVFNNTNNE